MTARPILFGGPMIQAIFAGRKTQTRRVVRGVEPYGLHRFPGEIPGRPGIWAWWTRPEGESPRACDSGCLVRCPYGTAGDRLWVRESWRQDAADSVHYRADEDDGAAPGQWRSGRYMRRAQSRIDLEVVSVRMERLNAISVEDSYAEGIPSLHRFATGWDYINGRREGCRWEDDPWVWRIGFRRLEVS